MNHRGRNRFHGSGFLELLFQLHTGGQLEFVLSPERFKLAACGRRWGKTVAGAAQLAASALDAGTGRWRALWVAPTHDQADEAVELLRGALEGAGAVQDWSASLRRLTFAGGAVVFFRSAAIPRNLRGKGWDLLVVDEAAFVSDDVWNGVLRPALMDRLGHAVLLSTPAGARGWFYEMYLRGESGKETPPSGLRAWRFPSWRNPYLAASEIEAMRESLPERVFRQEIAAEFLAGEGVVFERFPMADYTVPSLPSGQKSKVVIGCDLAKHEDYTVLVALDAAGRIVDFKRFNRIEYTAQARIIADMAARYGAPVYLDATGVGEAVLDLLRQPGPWPAAGGVEVVPILLTHSTKRQLIQNLVVEFEQNGVIVPASLEVLVSELRAFAAFWTPAGVVYSAPRGLHDDCVMALALAAWGQRRMNASTATFEDFGGSFL